MQLTISIDFTTMEHKQREAFLAFLMLYHPYADEMDKLQAECEEPLPIISGDMSDEELNNAIRIDNPNLIFGAAPSIVDVAPPSTALGVTLGTSTGQTVPSIPVVPPVPLVHAPPHPVSLLKHAETDKNGLPWDRRIHTATKSKNKDGSWTYGRGIDKDIIPQVENQLRHLMNIHTTPPLSYDLTQPLSSPAYIPPITINKQLGDSNFAKVTDSSPPAIITFPQLMGKISAACMSGKVKKEEIDAIVQNLGVPGIPLLVNRPDLLTSVDDAFTTLLASK